MRSVRSYQREIAKLRGLVEVMQWVRPTYNGSPSCSYCGAQEHWGCERDCEAAKLTGNRGKPESGKPDIEAAS